MRRCLCYPLVRHFRLATAILADVVALLKLGRLARATRVISRIMERLERQTVNWRGSDLTAAVAAAARHAKGRARPQLLLLLTAATLALAAL